MPRRFLAALVLASCAHAATSAVPLFDCRMPVAPLLADLHRAGGDPSKVLHPASTADLAALQSGARYKFVVLGDGHLAIAPDPADAPKNAYHHPVLANGEPVRTAGGIRVEHQGGLIQKVILDPGSSSYCPSTGSLQAALDALVSLGVDAGALRVDNRPPTCLEAGAAAGSMMAPERPSAPR